MDLVGTLAIRQVYQVALGYYICRLSSDQPVSFVNRKELEFRTITDKSECACVKDLEGAVSAGGSLVAISDYGSSGLMRSSSASLTK